MYVKRVIAATVTALVLLIGIVTPVGADQGTKITVTGVVTDLEGMAIAGITVGLYEEVPDRSPGYKDWGTVATTRSNAEGAFSFTVELDDAGVYTLEGWGNGYYHAYLETPFTRADLLDNQLPPLRLKRVPPIAVVGTVTDDGRPVEWLEVLAVRATGYRRDSWSSYTDRDGRYELRLHPGVYQVSFVGARYSATIEVTVPEGDVVQTVDHELPSGQTVSGKITVLGEPLANAAVWFYPWEAWEGGGAWLDPIIAETAADGTYTARRVLDGVYTMRVIAPGRRDWYYGGGLTRGGSPTRTNSFAVGATMTGWDFNLPLEFAATPSPRIRGTATVGKKLTAVPGKWAPSSLNLTYQWLRSDKAIKGATKSAYTLVAADKGKKISVQVTGSLDGYATTSRTSAATKAVKAGKLAATPKPKISGTARVGKTLKAKAGKWKPATVKLSYQWQRNGKKIKGATKSSYKLAKADKGKKITVKVKGSKAGYSSASTTSKRTVKVK